MSATDPMSSANKRRCAATSKRTGRPCGQYVTAAQTVCLWHGALAPQVKQAVDERLRNLCDPALDELKKLVDSAASEKVRLSAALGVLDRAGYGPNSKHELTGKDGGPIVVDDPRERLARRLAEFSARTGQTEDPGGAQSG